MLEQLADRVVRSALNPARWQLMAALAEDDPAGVYHYVMNGNSLDFIVPVRENGTQITLHLFEYALTQPANRCLTAWLRDCYVPPHQEYQHLPLLVWAARFQRVDLVQQLLEAGADCRQYDSTGKRLTPIMHAARGSHVGVMAALLDDETAVVEQTDADGNTALCHASDKLQYSEDDKEIIRMLLAKGANRYHKNRLGDTPAAMMEREANFDPEVFQAMQQQPDRSPAFIDLER